MKTQHIPLFQTLNKAVHPRLLPDNQLSNVNNVFFKDGKIKQRWGYSSLGSNLPLSGRISLITNYIYLRQTNQELIVCTDKDIYIYNAGPDIWEFLTPYYATGTASCAGGTAVTGTGTTWITTWPNSTYYIKFGTNDPDSTGTPDTWYEIDDFTSATALTLDSAGPSTGGAVNYVIRQCYQTGEAGDWQVCYVIEPPGSTDELWAIFTNGADNVQVYTGTGQCSDLTGVTVKGKFIKEYYDHILLAWGIDTGNNLPQSIYWNDRGDPEEWSSGSSGYVDLLQGEEQITGMELLNQRLYVFKETSIIECYYTGSSSNPFEFQEDKIVKAGAPNGKTIINTGSEIIFLGLDNVFSFNGFQAVPIGNEVSQSIIQSMITEYAYKNFAIEIKDEYLYCLFVVTQGTEPDKAFVYNYQYKSWSIWTMADFMRTHGTFISDVSQTWENAIGTWAEQTGQWNIRTLTADSYFHGFGDNNGNVYQMNMTVSTDNGTNIDVLWETKDFKLIEYDRAVRLMKTVLTAEQNSGVLQIQCSTDFGNTWSDPVTIDQDTGNITEHVQNWIRRGEYFRFRIINVDGCQLAVESLRIGFKDAGETVRR